MSERSTLIHHLQAALSRLASDPFPTLETPPNIKKRASVALIIRVSPSYSHWPPGSIPRIEVLDDFFDQDWVQHGRPEVLFIKRAARKGDRWTSHIALPGGKRDPEDQDDLAAAIRETLEEVGLDVSPSNPYVLQAGNLPQRVITAHWGKVPLMVLCPYVFLLTGHDYTPLRMQPTEVASCHWVPLKALLDPKNRTTVREDVSNRLANQETGIKKWMLAAMVGKMIFSAIHLRPTESVRCNLADSPNGDLEYASTGYSQIRSFLANRLYYDSDPPLLLWGLTLVVMADLLDLLPPYDALKRWDYPTFSFPDARLAIWLVTYNFRKQKARQIAAIHEQRNTGLAEGRSRIASKEAGMHGLGTGGHASSAVATMLDGYYGLVRKAVAFALATRLGMASLIAYLLVRHRARLFGRS